MLLLFFAVRALAGDLTFADALARVDRTPALRAAVAESEARSAEARATGAWNGNPTLSGELRADEQELTLAVPLDLGGVAKLQAASASLEAERARASAARAAVSAAVGAAWLDARHAADQAALWQTRAEAARQLGAAAAARAKAGEWSAGDAALAMGEAASLRTEAGQAELDARAANRALASLLGEASGSLLSLGSWPELGTPPELSAASLPRVVTANLDARAALAASRAASMSALPELELEGGWVSHSGEGAPMAGLSLELPLFAPRQAGAKAARSLADQAEALRELAASEADALLLGAREELADAEAVAALWAGIDLSAARAGVDARYAAGDLSLAAWLETSERLTHQAELAIDARWRVARARLALWELAGLAPEVRTNEVNP